jgi:hypothetical protein
MNLVTFGGHPGSYAIDWTMTGRIDGATIELGAGKIDAASIRDWQTIEPSVSTFPEGGPVLPSPGANPHTEVDPGNRTKR